MAIEFDPAEQWDRVAAELRAYKETQQQAWGDIDNATLGRYLAGDLGSDERKHIEHALTQLPELRKLTDIVRDVLDEFDSAAPAPLAEAPKVIHFPPPRRAKPLFSRALRSRGALLAACLLLGLGLTLVSMRVYTMIGPANPGLALQQANAEKENGLEISAPGLLSNAADPPDKRPHLMMAKATPSKEKVIVDGWKQIGTSATTVLAATQEELGDFYQQHGDYDRAESFLSNARELWRQAHGDLDPKTIQTSQKLAEVCERATQRQIQQISRRHHVEFTAEIVPNLTDNIAKKAQDRAKDRPNGICLLICKEPPSVQVVVADRLRQMGFTRECQAELLNLVEESVKKREFDRGLLQAVRFVTLRCEQVAQHTKIGAGAIVGGAGLATLPR